MEQEGEGEGAPNVAARHINKRALKNKALSISFNDKDLRYTNSRDSLSLSSSSPSLLSSSWFVRVSAISSSLHFLRFPSFHIQNTRFVSETLEQPKTRSFGSAELKCVTVRIRKCRLSCITLYSNPKFGSGNESRWFAGLTRLSSELVD